MPLLLLPLDQNLFAFDPRHGRHRQPVYHIADVLVMARQNPCAGGRVEGPDRGDDPRDRSVAHGVAFSAAAAISWQSIARASHCPVLMAISRSAFSSVSTRARRRVFSGTSTRSVALGDFNSQCSFSSSAFLSFASAASRSRQTSPK